MSLSPPPPTIAAPPQPQKPATRGDEGQLHLIAFAQRSPVEPVASDLAPPEAAPPADVVKSFPSTPVARNQGEPTAKKVPPLAREKGTTRLVGAGGQPGRWRGRAVRTVIGLALLSVVGAFISDRFFGLGSRKAVLSGVPITLRAPIDGMLAIEGIVPGEIRDPGLVFGTVHDERVDDSRMRELAAALRIVEAEVASHQARLLQMNQEGAAALERAESFRRVRIEQLEARIAETDAILRGAQARVREAEATLRRSQTLIASGTASAATYDQVRRAQAVAHEELAAAQQRRAALVTQWQAAEAGVFAADEANNDRSTSQQTQDRIRLSSLELAAALRERQERLDAVRQQFQAEQQRLARLRTVTLNLPTRGRLVQLMAQMGEYVRQGQEIASFVDCSQPLALVEVEERVFQSLSLGMAAVFTPARSADRFEGEVVQLLSPLLAMSSAGREGGQYRVVVRLRAQPLAQRCDIGRMGRVSFS
jgi:multidrug resistance efflux pump